jgi:hypothetical protein
MSGDVKSPQQDKKEQRKHNVRRQLLQDDETKKRRNGKGNGERNLRGGCTSLEGQGFGRRKLGEQQERGRKGAGRKRRRRPAARRGNHRARRSGTAAGCQLSEHI